MPKKKKSSLGTKLKKSGVKLPKKRTEPVWKGPEVDGVTQSLLGRFLVCRERFRLLVMEGLKPADQFNHKIEYGNMWHLCEETLAADKKAKSVCLPTHPLLKYVQKLCKRYPVAQEQIAHWYNVCKIQFPLYIDYWNNHKDTKQRTPLLQEQTFNVPYELPSGRVVRLRGKWDDVSLYGKGKKAKIYLGENKTKGDIKEDLMQRQLQFDLQTMIYLVALTETIRRETLLRDIESLEDEDVAEVFRSAHLGRGPILRGVKYNVVRRPLSGGKGTIRQHKATKTKPAETSDAFYKRVGQYIIDEPGHYFMRWTVDVTSDDIERFKREFLNPILESLCLWWSWISSGDPWETEDDNSCHWRAPYGIWNPLLEGGSTDLDEYLNNGSTVGLCYSNDLFPELGNIDG